MGGIALASQRRSGLKSARNVFLARSEYVGGNNRWASLPRLLHGRESINVPLWAFDGLDEGANERCHFRDRAGAAPKLGDAMDHRTANDLEGATKAVELGAGVPARAANW